MYVLFGMGSVPFEKQSYRAQFQNTGLSTFLATVVSGREHPQRHADFVGRVRPDGTRTSHTLPLPPFASPARALVANKHQHS